MHPILTNPRWLGLYVLGWLPVGVLLAAGLRGDAPWLIVVALVVPLTVVHAFVGLSSWYVCQSFPIERGLATGRAVFTHVVTATVSSGLWVTVGGGWAWVVDAATGGNAARALLTAQRPLLTLMGTLLFLVAAGVHYLLMASQEIREAENRALEQQVLARDAELKAVRTQIDPHFLFNSLHSISALTTSNAPAARRMCVLLADFFRDTLRLGARTAISLAEELSLAERYLAVEKVRLGARLKVSVTADAAARDCQVPPLLLQPVVENAIVHGVRHLLEGGGISLTAMRDDDSLSVTVSNPCDPDRPRSQGTGLGLELLRRRLGAQFGSRATVRAHEHDGHYEVQLRVPRWIPDERRVDD